MHTKVIQSDEFGEIRIHYNSDFSGKAAVSWREDDYYCYVGERTSYPGGVDGIPAELFRPLIDGGWISVEDELPEIGVSVLVATSYTFGGGIFSGNGTWYIQPIFEVSYHTTSDVIRWQPLPEPPAAPAPKPRKFCPECGRKLQDE